MAWRSSWARCQLVPGDVRYEWKWKAGSRAYLQNVPHLCQTTLTQVWHLYLSLKYFKGSVYFITPELCCVFCRFLSELGRHNYVTPTSYLELIAAFRLLLTQKRDTVMKAKQRYTNGLDKLAFAESQVSPGSLSLWLIHFCLLYAEILSFFKFNNILLQVGEMKKELVDLQPKLEQAKIDNTKMMKVKNTSWFSLIRSLSKNSECNLTQLLTGDWSWIRGGGS